MQPKYIGILADFIRVVLREKIAQSLSFCQSIKRSFGDTFISQKCYGILVEQ